MKYLTTSLLLVVYFGFAAFEVSANSIQPRLTTAELESLESDAAAGNDKAQMKLAIMYLEGSGVTADINRSLYFYRLAAERDIAFAQHRLAQLYLDGNYVEPDPTRALGWLSRAAQLGFIQAQLDLSLLYENGQGIIQDFVEAHKWLSIASSLTETDLDSRREKLEAKMTFVELAQAEFHARICILNGYRDC